MTPNTAVFDEAGRYIAPPQPVVSPRPMGPWTTNVAPKGRA